MIFRSRSRLLLTMTALALIAGLVHLGRQAFVIEPDSLVVAEYAVELPGWPASLDGFRIAAVGDVHGGAPYIDERKLEEVTRRITAAKPDLIAGSGTTSSRA